MDRQALISDIFDEFMLHGPGGVMRAMRRWPSGPVSLVHLHVLMFLDTDGPQPMGVIAEALDVSQASVTGFIDRMVQRDLVVRQRGDADRRVVRVGLTETGRRMIQNMATERRERMLEMLDTIDDADLAALLRGSRALRLARERLLGQLESGAAAHAHPTTKPDAPTEPDR